MDDRVRVAVSLKATAMIVYVMSDQLAYQRRDQPHSPLVAAAV